MAFVDDVHLQRENMTHPIDQAPVGVKEKAVLGALHPVKTDLRLVARVGAEHALEKAAIKLELGISNELHRGDRIIAALAGIKRRRQPMVSFQREVKHLFILRRRLARHDRPAALGFITVVENPQLVIDDVPVANDPFHRPWPLIVDIRIEHRTGPI